MLVYLGSFVGGLAAHLTHILAWALLTVTGCMGVWRWPWWSPIPAGIVAALILVDALARGLSINALFGSGVSVSMQIAAFHIIIAYAGFVAGRLIQRRLRPATKHSN